MKFLLFIIQSLLLIKLSQQYSTAALIDCTDNIIKSCEKCDTDINNKCGGENTSPYKSDQCKYVRENIDKYTGTIDKMAKTWDEDYGVEWHGCQQNCVKELSGDSKKQMEKYRSCNSQLLSFIFLALSMTAILLV